MCPLQEQDEAGLGNDGMEWDLGPLSLVPWAIIFLPLGLWWLQVTQTNDLKIFQRRYLSFSQNYCEHEWFDYCLFF